MKFILLVEDDDMKARAVSRVVSRKGLDIVRAETVVAAYEVINLQGEDIIAVITDWNFPMRSGEHPKEVGYRIVRECRRRGLRFVVISGAEVPDPDVPTDNWIEWTTGGTERLIAWVDELAKCTPSLPRA